MDCKTIIVEYLRRNGFDGLCEPETECGCGLMISRRAVMAHARSANRPRSACSGKVNTSETAAPVTLRISCRPTYQCDTREA